MFARVLSFLHSPFAIGLALVAGVAVGIYTPDLAHALAPLSRLYVDLLTMVVLPFIVSSIVFSLRSLIHDPQAKTFLVKIVASVLVVTAAAAIVGGALALTMRPGDVEDPDVRLAFGRVVADEAGGANLEMDLHGQEAPAAVPSPVDRLVAVVPSNIFAALAAGDTLKVLVFALLFGLAVGFVPHAISNPFAFSLETVYRACIVLTRWFNVLLPFATFAMIAHQIASVGLDSLSLMLDFLLVMGIATAVLVLGSVLVIAWRSGRSPLAVLRAHQDVLVMAVATRSSVACIPVMIDTLTERLRFRRDVVELLVPLQTALVRAGPVLLFVVGAIFVAQLYGKPLSPTDLLFLGGVAVLLGPVTSGMTGILVVSQVGIICGYLGLPFEAAFVLFASVDAATDTFRTIALVFTVNGAAAAIAPPESPETQAEPADALGTVEIAAPSSP
jgi:Na+/H+-dicarboxylate symporter